MNSNTTTQRQIRSPGLPDVLNLGCGEDYREHAHNVDYKKEVNPDEVLNLNKTTWPWPDNQFNRIIANHVLEHLDAVPLNELERVTTPGGTLIVRYPLGHTRFEDSTHRQYWGWHTAEALVGERKHSHETSTGFTLKSKTSNLEITGSAPLERLYIAYRKRVDGLGPWIEQVPGVYGEMIARYEYDPTGDRGVE